MVALPVNIDTTYADSDAEPSVKTHQQHHDVIHAAVNAFDTKADKKALPVSVLDPEYGLSGTTDNTAAIQAALDAAASQGRPLILPTRPAGQPYVVSGSGVMLKVVAGQVIEGDGHTSVVRVKAKNGNYKAIIGGATGSTNLSGLTIRKLTIDQNASGNPVAEVATLYADGTQRFCVLVGVGVGISLQGVRFTGISGLNIAYIGGQTVEEVRIQDCDFEGYVGAGTFHDHSSIYTSCRGATITGNRFKGTPGARGCTTAIETHGPGQVVANNRIRNFMIGMNITGQTNIGNDSIVVHDNTVLDVLIGIQLWSMTGNNGGLHGCNVHDNRITLDRDSWQLTSYAYPQGIMLAPTSNADIDDLTIHDNQIFYKSFSRASLTSEYQSAGLAFWLSSKTVQVRDLDVHDNLVVRSLGAGLRLGTDVVRGKIHGNTFVDPGCSLSVNAAMPYHRAGMNFGICDLTDVDVYDNKTYDTRAPHRVNYGIYTSGLTTALRCMQRNNVVALTDGRIVPAFVQTPGQSFKSSDYTLSPQFAPGLYYGPQGGRSIGPATNGQLQASPFLVGVSTSFVRIGCQVIAGGAASTTVRLGIYGDVGGVPGPLVLDAGTVRGDSVANREIAISQILPGGLYWLVLVGQGGTPTVRALATTNILQGAGVSTLAVATGAAPRVGFYMSGVLGALPSRFSFSGQTATPGLVVLRAA